MLNKVMLIGNLGKDVESITTGAGMQIAKVSLATTKSVKKGEKWEKKTEWHNLVAFNNTAEGMITRLKKGNRIYAEGEISTSSWDDENGNKKYRTEIIINMFRSLDAAPQEQSGAQKQKEDPKPPPVKNSGDGGIGDLPF